VARVPMSHTSVVVEGHIDDEVEGGVDADGAAGGENNFEVVAEHSHARRTGVEDCRPLDEAVAEG